MAQNHLSETGAPHAFLREFYLLTRFLHCGCRRDAFLTVSPA